MSDALTTDMDRLAGRVASLTEALTNLPAVATIDWTDRAAKTLTKLSPGALVCVLIGRLDEHGGMLSLDTLGVAGDGVADDASNLDDLRSRAHRLSSLGVAIDLNLLQARPVVGLLDQLSVGRDWRMGPVGKVLGAVAGATALLGVGALGAVEQGRSLIVLSGPVTTARDQALAKLRAVMPVLLRRAMVAIGPHATGTDDWLTERERIVLDRLILGESVREIADSLGRSPHTVHDHVKALHRKLKACSRGELVARALGHMPAGGDARRKFADDALPALAEPKPLRVNPPEPGRERATPAVKLVEG